MILRDDHTALSLEIEGYEYIFSNDPDEADLIVIQIGIESDQNLFSFSGHAIQRSTLVCFAQWLKACTENESYQLDEEGPIFTRTSQGLKIEFDQDCENSETDILSQNFHCQSENLQRASLSLETQLENFPSRLN